MSVHINIPTPNYKRCVIITSYNEHPIKDCLDLQPTDYIICADGGYTLVQQEQITPHLVVGDFDSYCGTIPATVETIRVAAEKDDTDTMLCVKIGIERGFTDFIICGGIGGRLDHTIGNLQALAYAIHEGKKLWICGGKDRVTMLAGDDNGQLILEHCHALKAMGYGFSLFSYSESCSGVFIRGAYYPLHDATLYNHIPIGVSNEFVDDTLIIETKTGNLLVILSKEEKKSPTE